MHTVAAGMTSSFQAHIPFIMAKSTTIPLVRLIRSSSSSPSNTGWIYSVGLASSCNSGFLLRAREKTCVSCGNREATSCWAEGESEAMKTADDADSGNSRAQVYARAWA